MIHKVQEFVDYYSGIRKRTLNYARMVPPAQINWAPREGEFTCADILRHIASGETMFVGVATRGRWKYDGHTGDQANLDELVTHLDAMHQDAMQALRFLPDAELVDTRRAFESDAQVKVWRWLMAMTEHEIHHRSQLAMYLLLLGVTPPNMYGVGVEDLIAKATG
jgi:uncharacterized damage-inducible protein DinB